MKMKTICKVLLGIAGFYISEPKKKDWKQPEETGFGDVGTP